MTPSLLTLERMKPYRAQRWGGRGSKTLDFDSQEGENLPREWDTENRPQI